MVIRKVNEVHESAEPAMADSEWQKSYGEGVQAFESQDFGAAKVAYERSLRMAENSLERAYSNSAIADCEFQPVIRYKGQILENARKIRESYNGAKHAEKVGEYVDQHIGQPIGLFNSRATVLIDILARAKESIPKARLFQSEAVEALKSHLQGNELLDDDVNVFLELLKEHVAVLTELKDYVDNTPNEVETFYRIREQIIFSKGNIPKAQLSEETRIRRKYEREFSGSGQHVDQHQLLDDLTTVVGGFRENTSNYSKLIGLVPEQEPATSESHDITDFVEKYKQVVDILSGRQRLGRRRRQKLISYDNAMQQVTEQLASIAMEVSDSMQPMGDRRFQMLLEETSSQVIEMPPDGLCMFHALAVGMQLHWNNLPNRAGVAAYLGSETVTTRNLFSVLAEIANVHATAFPEDEVIQQVAESFRARPGGSAAWGTNDTLNHYIPPLTGTDVMVLNLSDMSQAEQVHATVYRPDGRVDTLVGANINSYLSGSPHSLIMAFNGVDHWDLIVPEVLAQKAREMLRVMLESTNSQSKQ